jgi:hypothetical protein
MLTYIIIIKIIKKLFFIYYFYDIIINILLLNMIGDVYILYINEIRSKYFVNSKIIFLLNTRVKLKNQFQFIFFGVLCIRSKKFN